MTTPPENNLVVNSTNSINDPLYIASSDHPGMTLSNTLFNGSNFHGWTRTVRMALGAKLKLGFIDGSCVKPANDHADLQRWVRCDYMVTCWILNSMTSELSEAFLYATSASGLWKEIIERYGQSNGPLVYQLEQELASISQGNLTVTAFFNKLKRCWDELHNINAIPSCKCGKMAQCTCEIMKKFTKIENQSKLIQFLMNLNDGYESVRSHIMSMDPLPNINKAYYIVQQVEKQKEVTHHQVDTNALFANVPNNKSSLGGRRNMHKSESRGDNKRFCTHCKQDGHVVDQCFERIGYPDWYKGKKVKKNFKAAANASIDQKDTPLDFDFEQTVDTNNNNKII